MQFPPLLYGQSVIASSQTEMELPKIKGATPLTQYYIYEATEEETLLLHNIITRIEKDGLQLRLILGVVRLRYTQCSPAGSEH